MTATTTVSLLASALELHDAGLAVLPLRTDGTKSPAVAWAAYQTTRPSREQVATWFGRGSTDGVGMLTGAAGNVEMYEVEGRAAHRVTNLKVIAFDSGLGDLWERMSSGWLEQTPSGGFHWHAVVDGPIPGNTKLASRPATPDELADNPREKVKVLAETRGTGGFTILAPSNGRSHPTGRAWIRLVGGPASLPRITLAERDAFCTLLRTLDEMPPVEYLPTSMTSSTVGGIRPGDDLNARASWDDILTPHGWTKTKRVGKGYGWTRPGKNPHDGISATTGQNEADRLYVFSSSTEFDTETPYNKFGAYALLEHGGDYSAAAKALSAAGYGDRHTTTTTTLDRAPHDDLGGLIGDPPAPVDLDDFWNARPHLATIYQAARARRVVGGVLARVVAYTAPGVVLPPLVGGHASLNMFVALVGASGGGKGAASAVADDLLVVTGGSPLLTPTRVTAGSGEGMAHAYVRRTKDGVAQHTYSVLFDVPEVDTLAGLTQRRGTTLLPELRRAWSGEQLGFAYADPTKRLPVAAHSYRAVLIVGVQPGRGDAILGDSDGGTPQRFVWLPATDPGAPDDAPPLPEPVQWRIPRPTMRYGRYELGVCDTARHTIDSGRLARLRGEGDALDGHAALARLKVAGALALLDERLTVDDDDWDLAGTIQAVSNMTRASVQAALDENARQAGDRRAAIEARVAVRVAGDVDAAAIQRVGRWAMHKLAEGPLAWAALRRACAKRSRGYLDDAVDALVLAGQVVCEEVGDDGRRYRLADGTR